MRNTPEHARVKDWGVPDWHLGDPYAQRRSIGQWAWEFLRRNRKYRDFWQQFNDTAAEVFDNYSAVHAFNKTALTRFCLIQPCDPCNADDLPLWELPALRHFVRPAETNGGCYLPAIQLEFNEVAIVFDLDLPLNQQLALAKRVLQHCQSERRQSSARRLHVEHFPAYLRILDAKDSCATDQAIEDVLYPNDVNGPKNVSNQYATAKRYRDRDFRALAIMSTSR
jgi:hypothetical protein